VAAEVVAPHGDPAHHADARQLDAPDPKRNLFGPGPRLQTQEDPDKPNPRFIEAADKATRRVAQKLDATPQAGLTEQLFNIPTTAHTWVAR
jgi:hypothetical protein